MWSTKVNALFGKTLRTWMHNHLRKIGYKYSINTKLHPYEVIHNTQDKFRAISNPGGKYCFYPMDTYKAIWESAWFSTGEYKTALFEDVECHIPSNYHEVLRECYGDYMQLPPLEKRVSNHSYTAYRI